jgi:hypothetical protein
VAVWEAPAVVYPASKVGYGGPCWKPHRISRREKIPRLKRIKFNQAKGGIKGKTGEQIGEQNDFEIWRN